MMKLSLCSLILTTPSLASQPQGLSRALPLVHVFDGEGIDQGLGRGSLGQLKPPTRSKLVKDLNWPTCARCVGSLLEWMLFGEQLMLLRKLVRQTSARKTATNPLTNTSGFLEVYRLGQGGMQLFLSLAWLRGTKGKHTRPHFREARLDKPGS